MAEPSVLLNEIGTKSPVISASVSKGLSSFLRLGGFLSLLVVLINSTTPLETSSYLILVYSSTLVSLLFSRASCLRWA
jgi:hypothetical protein